LTTATKLTPAGMLERLEALLSAAADYAGAEDRIERLSAEIREHEDDLVDGLEHDRPLDERQRRILLALLQDWIDRLQEGRDDA
jgi:hypothetical protein